MKTMLILAAVLAAAPAAHAAPPTPQVAVARVTPGASPARVLAFQNKSSTLDIHVIKIEVVNASTMAVTSGLEAFWVYGSTAVGHSETTSQTAYRYNGALASQPSYVYVSTAPYWATFEGNAGPLTAAAANNLTGAKPLMAPLIVNLDETAAANLSASWSQEQGDLPLVLPAGSDRALVIEKRQFGGSDFTDGQAEIRVVYTVH